MGGGRAGPRGASLPVNGWSRMLAALPMAPVLLFQAQRLRRSIPRLPEPPGRRRGATGSGPPLKLLVVGDSAAAGVGAAHQDGGLLGRLVQALASDHTVQWRLEARSGATTAATLRRLRKVEQGVFDVVVTSLGVNDVTSGLSRSAWLHQQRELRELLRDSFGVSSIVCCGLPPVHGFPALPQPLRWYLGERATAFAEDLQADVAGDPRVRFLSLRFTEDTTLMASDGFHPGPAVYAEWGRRAARGVSTLAAATGDA